VTDIRVVVACPECGSFWPAAGGAPQCTDPEHHHQRFEVHRHRSAVPLPDGTEVSAVSFDEAGPYGRSAVPDFGLYLDPRWAPPWEHRHVDWPDFGVPADAGDFVAALRGVLDRARSGQRVEVGCLGGHGRTGTALACLAVLIGHPAVDAVEWVRTTYCSDAVETPEQEAFVAAMCGGTGSGHPG
jgi:hypothetical protein